MTDPSPHPGVSGEQISKVLITRPTAHHHLKWHWSRRHDTGAVSPGSATARTERAIMVVEDALMPCGTHSGPDGDAAQPGPWWRARQPELRGRA